MAAKLKVFTLDEILTLSDNGKKQILTLVPPKKDAKSNRGGTEYYRAVIKIGEISHPVVFKEENVVIKSDNNVANAEEKKEDDYGQSFAFDEDSNPKLFKVVEILDRQKDVAIQKLFEEGKLIPVLGKVPTISSMISYEYSRTSKAKDSDGKSLAGMKRKTPQGRIKFDMNEVYSEKYFVEALRGKNKCEILDASSFTVENNVKKFKPFMVNVAGIETPMTDKTLPEVIKRGSVIEFLRVEMPDVVNHKFGISSKISLLRAVVRRHVQTVGYDDDDIPAEQSTVDAAVENAVNNLTKSIATTTISDKPANKSTDTNPYQDD